MWEPEPSATCQYRHFTVAEAAKTLAKQQLVFAGDSMMRKLWYTFVHLILDPPGARPGQRVATKKDKTIVYSPALRTSGQFLWAPYGRRHNTGLGGDTRTVFPYDSVLHELYTGAEHPKPAASHPAGTAAKGSGVACERPCLLARSSLQPGDERLCSVGIGSGKHEQWQRFCEPPTTIVLHVGLWMTESWEENVADFAGYLRAEESASAAARRPALRVLLLLPLPVRQIRSPVPASGLQDDPTVEPEFRPEILRGIRGSLLELCATLRCCHALDGWEAAYRRAEDSQDGRHYEVSTPTMAFLTNLLLNAVAEPCPS